MSFSRHIKWSSLICDAQIICVTSNHFTNNPIIAPLRREDISDIYAVGVFFLPVFQEDIEAVTMSDSGDTSGRGNSFCGIYEGFLSASDTLPEKKTLKHELLLRYMGSLLVLLKIKDKQTFK